MMKHVKTRSILILLVFVLAVTSGCSGFSDLWSPGSENSKSVAVPTPLPMIAFDGVTKSYDDVLISAGYYHTVGLSAGGSVMTAGSSKVANWCDLIAVSAGYYNTVGLKEDGTVVATDVSDMVEFDESVDYGQSDVERWSDIVAISAGGVHTVGLKNDGTVVATGNNAKGQCDVQNWSGIVAISAGYFHTVGLKETAA